MLRVLCLLGLHRPVRVVDEYEVISVSPTGATGRILRSHRECDRCTRPCR